MTEPTYTKFPNHLLEAILKAGLSLTEFKIFLIVMRFTYGYHVESEELSVGTMAKYLECDKGSISKAVNKMLQKNILREVQKADFNTGRTLSVEEDTGLWQSEMPTVVKKPTPTVVKKPTPTVGKLPTPTYYIKENKERKYKRNKTSADSDAPSYDKELIKRLIDRD